MYYNILIILLLSFWILTMYFIIFYICRKLPNLNRNYLTDYDKLKECHFPIHPW